MNLRVRAGNQTSCVVLQGDAETLGTLRGILRQTLLPALGFSPDVDFSITLNGSDPLTEDDRSLQALGVVSGDLIVIVTNEIPTPQQLAPPAAPETQDVRNKRQKCKEGAAASGAHEAAEAEEAALGRAPGPMLCSEAVDGKIPHSLEMLYLSSGCSSASDALVILTHLLMLETGYKPEKMTSAVSSMPEDWRTGDGVYKLHYFHALSADSSAALVCVPMCKVLIINATLSIGGELKSVKRLQIPTDSYITYPQAGRAAASVYRDLQKLSCLFKDQLLYPLLAAARQALGLPDVFGLMVLPPELKLRIFRLLEVRSLLSLGETCKTLHEDIEDPSLWRFLYYRDFKDVSERPPDTDWKQLYKMQPRVLRRRRDLPYIFPPDHSPFHPDPFHPLQSPPNYPYPPGIIGGEYDQRPTFPFARDPLSLINPRRPYELGLFRPARPRINPLLPGFFGESSHSSRGPFL
ncbi:F-box only protein 7 isoform 1-T4 [Anomaloglossus baeobatrachus]|uniref:F-box only protein 7 n=1 Tax=Anomaloglossus baeobatrachus TaxID=238106 RepID=UPI003F4F4BEE